MMNRLLCFFTLSICGGIFLLSSLVLLGLWSSIYFSVLKNQLMLTNTSKSYELWKETPIPMYLELYLYNFSNVNEVMKNPKNVKPYFVEMGPYVFREHHLKVNKTWNKNDTITFWQRRTWEYEPSMSNGSLTDSITNINPVTASVAHIIRQHPEIPTSAIWLLNIFLKGKGEDVVTTKTAGELLFDGYKDPVMDFLAEHPEIGFHFPFDKFGWFYDRNNSDTYDGVMNMFTGIDDINKLGLLDSWNYKENVSYYEGKCGTVNGGTGELFPPLFDPPNVTVFATDVCSGITLKRDGDTTIHDISGSLFVGDESVFDDGKKFPENKCFCTNKGKCAPSGFRDVSQCKFGAPAFVSFPHFYLADTNVSSKIDGIVSNKEEDEFKLGLEVVTGIPLLVKAQLQINLYIEKTRGLSMFNKLPSEIYIPMLWFRQEVTLTEEYASQAKFALFMSVIVEYVLYAIIAISIIVLIASAVCLMKVDRSSESQVLISEER